MLSIQLVTGMNPILPALKCKYHSSVVELDFKKLIVYETEPAKRNNLNPDKVQIAFHKHIHHSSSTKLRSTTEEQNALCE